MKNNVPVPANEAARLQALSAYNILDTLPEEAFDRLTKLAAIICDTPIALVTLLDKDRQWFKSNIGLDVPQTARDISFCQYAIGNDLLLEIEDATKDERFVNNPLVTGRPHIKFYAGYPLIDHKGYALGTLCVIDRQSRKLNDGQQKALALLANEVVSQIVAREKNAEKDKLEKLFDLSTDLICVLGNDGYFKKINPAFTLILGWSMAELLAKPVFDFIHPDDIPSTLKEIEKLNKGQKTIGYENRYRTKNNHYLTIRWVANLDAVTGEFYAIGRYDSERIKWEQALLLSEERYRGFYENSQGLMCMHDLDGNFISINPAGASTLGYSVEELSAKNLFDIVPVNIKPLVQDYLAETEKNGASKGLMQIVHKNGSLRIWMYNNIISERNDGSKFIIGTALDITERVLLEKKLKESNDRFFKIFDKNPLSMVISNMETLAIEYVNEMFLEMLGFTKEEVIGKTVVELNVLSTEDRDKALGLMHQQGALRSVEAMISKKNGQKIWVLVSLELVQINDTSFILSSLLNIDERKKMEEEISRLAESQKIILDGTDYSIITTSEPEGIIQSFNKGAEKMLGYKAEEMIGITPEIIHDKQEIILRAKQLTKELKMDIAPGIDAFHVKSRLANKSDVNEWTYIAKNGSRIPVELSITTLRGYQDQILGYLGIAKDISEIKKTKDAIINAKEKAEQAVIAKNSFLANMSHEIRTPMNSVIGYAELLAQSKLDEEQSEYVGFIKTAGINLLSIINDILDFSKIESGKIIIESVPFNLKSTLNAIYHLLKIRAVEKKLDYNFLLDASLPDFVCGDSVRLNQILINLIGNAIKFTPSGHVTVSAKKVEEDALSYKLKFVVKDSGIGIAADKIDVIFERFTQANTETTRKFGGTGLGLSIAKNLVELQGGKLNLKSKIGKGAEFSFEIIYKKVEQSMLDGENMLALKKPAGIVKILLFEDNILNQKLAKKVITKFGFDVEIADNGKLGVEKLKNERFDLVLMDLQMPEMDGYQAALAIRNELKLRLPIIALTAHSLAGEKEKCLETGMNDYIGKPFNQEELYYKICSNLPGQQQVIDSGSNKQKAPGSRIINLDSLMELSGGNKAFEKEMITLFLESVPADMDALENAFEGPDASRIKTIAHKLKSSMSVVGLSGLNDDFGFIEKNASTKEMREISFQKFIFVKNILSESYTILQKKLTEEY